MPKEKSMSIEKKRERERKKRRSIINMYITKGPLHIEHLQG
jgi:hypothetical protein